MKIVQKIMSIVLMILVPVMAYPIQTSAADVFSDIAWHQYKESIEFLYKRGVVKWYPNGTFGPNTPISRAEMMKIILEWTKLPLGSWTNCFPDVKDDWYVPYVCYGKENNIIKWYPDGTFQPNKKVTFAEWIKIALSAFKSGIQEAKDDYWYQPYLDYLHENNVFSRYAVIPYNEMTRGQMASLAHKLILKQEWTLVFDNQRDVASLGCGKEPPNTPPAMSLVNGDIRNYISVIWRNYNKNTPTKLIIAFHGRTNPNTMVRWYYKVEQASKWNAIIIYPSGLPEEWPTRSWSSPWDPASQLRDFALFDQIVKDFTSRYCINRDQIFVVGHSLWAWFTNSLACARGDVIRAVGSVGGGTTINKCAWPVAAVIMHHPQDSLATFKSGEIARDQLLKQSSCGEPAMPVWPQGGNCVQYTCQKGASVIRCPHSDGIDERGQIYTHTWPDFAGQYIRDFFDSQK